MEKSRIDLPIGITLDRFIKSNQSQYPNAAGELSQLLRDIALASKVVNREINKAGLIDIMGYAGVTNSGGDHQQKLDLLANTRFTRALSKGGEACGIASEETEQFIDLKRNQGDEEMRARDLFYALWIPDLFMEKVKKDEEWYLMCPNMCPGLSDVYGEDFNQLYNLNVKN